MTVIAILVSDIHFSHNPPIARNNEPNWYDAMMRQVRFLKELQKEHDNPPIVVAGDVFDRWNTPPALINRVLAEAPTFYAVAGQHDLPFHSLSEIKKSAYWTLVEAGKLINIPHDKPLSIELSTTTLFLYGFPFGFPLHDPEHPISERSNSVHIAVIHDYCWQSGFSYSGAPTEKSVEEHSQSAGNYDILHFGDNHKGFLKRVNRHQIIFNGGTFYRRNIDEVDYCPMVGLVYDNSDVKPVYVPVNKDILSIKVQETKSEENVEIDNFVNYLSKISLNGIDIEEAIAQYMVMHSVSDAVRTEITGLLEITRHG